MTERGLLEEIALAGAEHLDPAYAARYDGKARVDPSGDLNELRACGLGSDSTLIDLGAGTGTFALAASSICRRVVAVDVSPAMVTVTRRKVAEGGVTNVEVVEAGFLTYEHSGAPPDFIYTRNALHHLPDFWKAVALRRIADLLPPGGLLRLRDLVFAFDLRGADGFVRRWLDAAAAERPNVGWTRVELETHLRDEYSTFSWLLEPMLERAGFRIVRADYGRLRIYADYTCVKRES